MYTNLIPAYARPVLVGLWVLACGLSGLAQEGGTEAGAIVLKADATQGVAIVGKVKPVEPTGKPEDVAASGMADEPLLELAKWKEVVSDERRVEFTPDLPASGYYDVYLRWYTVGFILGGVADAVPVRVEHADGVATLMTDQRMGSVWVYLGAYRFEPGDGGRVVIDAQGTVGRSNVNAVKFVPTAKPAAKPRVLPAPAGEPSDFDKLRAHYAKLATPNVEADISDPRMYQKVLQEEYDTYYYWKTMRRDTQVPELWTNPRVGRDISKNEAGGWPLVRHYERIHAMARAYVGSNTELGFADKMQGNPELLDDILYALHFLYENRFNERTRNKLGADWIGNEISQPLLIASTINLIYPHIEPAFIEKQVATFQHMAPSPLKMYGNVGVTTGFNRLYACYAWAHRGLMNNDAEMIAFARDAIADEYQLNNRSQPIVRNGKVSLDGFYEDGSFIQHGAFPYIGIYGRGVLEYFGYLKAMLEDSPWQIDDPAAQVFNRWVLEGYAPLFFNGDIMYGSLGRSTGQSWHQNGTVSSENINAIAPLIPLADDAATRKQLAGVVRAWLIDKDTCAFPQFNRLDMERIDVASYAILRDVRADESIEPIRPQPGAYIFHNSDYAVHHQPGFAAQLRMHSTRTKTHENLHQGTNMQGWYQGEGTLFIYDADNSRYQDNFWPTVDPYRLPGITVDTRSRADDLTKDGDYGQSPWAGGVSLDGFGMASMQVAAEDTTLTANKGWFFFEDQIICLGAAITSRDDRNIETVIENAKLHGEGDNTLTINGQAQPTELGWSAVLEDVKWAHLTGTVPGSDLAWVFVEPTRVNALREMRTGTWLDSFKRDKNTPEHRRHYLTLWQGHGKSPTDAGYAYIVLPGRSAEETKAYAQKMPVEVVANTAEVHAVRYPSAGLLAISFWTAEESSVAGITCTGQANVIVRETADQLAVAVSDPTQLGTTITLAFDQSATELVSADESVKVESLNPLRLSIDVRQSDGRPYIVRLKK